MKDAYGVMMTQSGVNMMQSVSQRAKLMSKKDAAQAVKARNYQEILAWPATDRYVKVSWKTQISLWKMSIDPLNCLGNLQ